MSYNKIIFGDNQFLGVNHSNQAKASYLYEKFSKPNAILQVLSDAYDEGIRDFMFTTHDRYIDVFEEIRRSNLFPGMYFTPCLPYAHKYWNQLYTRGPASLIANTVLQVNPIRFFPALFDLIFGNGSKITSLVTDIEILMCKGLPVRGVFLQNAAFDFLVALDQIKIIEGFAEGVENRLGVIPGFITMNHSRAVDVLCDRIGLVSPWVCANYNIAGFRMNPAKSICEDSFATRKTRNIAMSIFSSGRYSPSEAIDHISNKLDEEIIDSVLFGSSNAENIRFNVNKLNNVSPY